MRKMDIVVSRFTCWACRMRFNSSGVFKIEYRAALRPPHRVVSLAASQCGFLKGPVGIFYKCDYVAHMQTELNNPPRAHSWKIEFPSQTLSLSNFWATLELSRIELPRENQKKNLVTANSSGAQLFASFYTPLQDDKYGNKYWYPSIKQYLVRIIVGVGYLNSVKRIGISMWRRSMDNHTGFMRDHSLGDEQIICVMGRWSCAWVPWRAPWVVMQAHQRHLHKYTNY